MGIKGLLVIVSCGNKKIWDNRPVAGPTPAKDSYTSSIFVVSRKYAEEFAEKWVILSAKYGLIEPEFVIPSDYNKRLGAPDAISLSDLKAQVREKGLDNFPTIAILGSYDYWEAIRNAFQATASVIHHVKVGSEKRQPKG